MLLLLVLKNKSEDFNRVTRFGKLEVFEFKQDCKLWCNRKGKGRAHTTLHNASTVPNKGSRNALENGFDSLEEGGLRASSSYSRDINEHDNDKAIETLHDKVSFLKRLTGDIHEEVESHNQLLDRVGNKMDASRGMMMGTMDRFKKVFEKKSARKTCSYVGYFTLAFIFIYYLIR
ncbi:hypothetical protein V8G54_029694 [Vigna mungo]|uniref:t-SNARE coiled-coil homology domain-containing protein n=1 Tax=Vigna mungo TaxID=3915 RepID=A0AAQ3RM25_VIGMU